MKKICLAAFAASSLFAVSAQAATTVYTDRTAFLNAIANAQTDGFSAPAGGYTAVGATYTGATFSIGDSNGNAYEVDSGFDPYYMWNSGAVYDAEHGALTITAGTGVKALGFDFGNPGSVNSANNTITIDGVDYDNYAQPTFGFYGVIGDGDLDPISVNFNGGLGILDNVTTGDPAAVPETATWAMFIAGFGMVGGAIRRKNTAVSFA